MKYVANKGLEVGGTYYIPGDTITDLPAEAVGWLLECGAILEAGAQDQAPKKSKKGGA